MISIEWDLRDVVALIDAGGKVYKKAAAQSMNRAAMKQRTAAVRRISAETKVRPSRLIRRRTRIDRAKPANLVVALRIITRPIRVAALAGARETRTGVSATGGRAYPGAFLARGKGGHEMAFKRRGKERLPLDALKVEVRALATKILEEELGKATELVKEELPKQLVYLMEKERKK